MGRYTEDVDYVPGSVNEPAHASHRPAEVSQVGARTAENDAAAFAALGQAKAMLATSKAAIKTPRWW